MKKMGQKGLRADLKWVNSDEPHASRQKVILDKYPQIKKLFGHNPNLKYVASALIVTQLAMLFVMKGQSWSITLVVAYCFGAVINHSLMAAIHEVGHDFAFGHACPTANRLFEFFCNLPLGIPGIVSMQNNHLEHHRCTGVKGIDSDLLTPFEAKLFSTTFGKFCWVCLLPMILIFRQLFVNSRPLNRLEIINAAIQLIFDAFVVYFFGWRVLWYLIIGTILNSSLHPVAGHTISRYYMVAKRYKMYSYYGPMNLITFNIGCNSEHHDFLAIPGSRLGEVKKIAAEFYDNLPQHTSLIRVFYNFIADPSVGPYARIKRKQRDLGS